MPTTASAARSGRAPALAVDERRAMILDAVIPLLLAQGADVTSRQIAEAAGVAEGTVFRAFGDKESLIEAAVQKHFDPENVRTGLRGIDPDDPFESKLAQVIAVLRARLTGVMQMMAALGRHVPPPPPQQQQFGEIMAQVFAAEAERLALPPARLAQLLRVMAFGSAIPQAGSPEPAFSEAELARILAPGLKGEPA